MCKVWSKLDNENPLFLACENGKKWVTFRYISVLAVHLWLYCFKLNFALFDAFFGLPCGLTRPLIYIYIVYIYIYIYQLHICLVYPSVCFSLTKSLWNKILTWFIYVKVKDQYFWCPSIRLSVCMSVCHITGKFSQNYSFLNIYDC